MDYLFLAGWTLESPMLQTSHGTCRGNVASASFAATTKRHRAHSRLRDASPLPRQEGGDSTSIVLHAM